MQTLQNIKNRIYWIDALRGFTMFLVVFGHTLSSEGINAYDDTLSILFITFRMPMFFFVSGFIAYKSWEYWNLSFYKQKILNKAKVQLIPTFIFFSFFCISNGISPLSFFKYGLGGYWFTLVLFEMFCIYYTISFLTRPLKGSFLNIILVVLSCGGILVLLYLRNDGTLWNILCLENLTKYFQFFTFGLLAKKYKDKFFYLLENDKFITVFTIIFVTCLFAICTVNDIRMQYGIIGSFIHDILVRYAGILVVLSYFYSKRTYFEQDSKIKHIMCFVGKRTLDIYMIHYFLLPNIPMIKPFFENNIIFEFTITAFIAILILSGSLAISAVLRNSSILKEYLFGIKSNK